MIIMIAILINLILKHLIKDEKVYIFSAGLERCKSKAAAVLCFY